MFGVPLIFEKNNKDRLDILKKKRSSYYLSFESKLSKRSPKNLIVIYDIPDNKKIERDWFRRQLVRFHYVMIQRSVWVGPSPLPKDFLNYLNEIKMKENIKTFKLQKDYKL